MAAVLVIDDNATFREFCRMVLEAALHVVVEAPDGKEGLEAFERERPDLVLCDLFMPEQDGLGVIRELRRLSPATRVVAMSGGGTRAKGDFLETARAMGASDTLSKPFGREELLEAVAKALAAG
jgi:CheY-like chemotaxis protein